MSPNNSAHAFGASPPDISPLPLTIRTRGRAAEIHLLLTVEAREARRTVAGVASIGVIGTSSPIEARAIGTGHGAQLTDLAIEAGRAGAREAVLKVLWKGDETTRGFLKLFQEPTHFIQNQGSRLQLAQRSALHPRLTVQLAPFLQGLGAHSSTSSSQLAPVYPGRQEHV